MINYKGNLNNQNFQSKSQSKIRFEVDKNIPNDQDFEYWLTFQLISSQLSSNDNNNISEAINSLRSLDKNAFLCQAFCNLQIPKTILNCIRNQTQNFIIKQLCYISCNILSINDQKLSNEFTKFGIIEIFQKFYMNDNEEIFFVLQTFASISSVSISARNIILKNIDIQFFCMFDDHKIAYSAYNLTHNLCLFGLSTQNCNYIITILINGINMHHTFAFDIIFQTIYQISYAQEKNWYSLLSNHDIETIFMQYFQNLSLRPKILHIFKRIVETSFILSDQLISLLFYFLQVDPNHDTSIANEEESLEIISDIFFILIQNLCQIESLFKFNIIDALFIIAENGNCKSKINSIYSLTKLNKYIVAHLKSKNDVISFTKRLTNLFIQSLSFPQQDIVLYIIISLINIVNDSISQNSFNLIFSDQSLCELFDNLNDLQSHEDTLIVEKAQYLINLFQSFHADE